MSDIDIDFKNRDDILKIIKHTPASIVKNNKIKKHSTGIYVQNIPKEIYTGYSTIDYNEAEDRGYFKIDFLNLSIYKNIKNEKHLNKLLTMEPLWQMLTEEVFVKNLFQIYDHFSVVSFYSPKSIEELSMVIALLRPAKKHLIGKPFKEIKKEIWQKPKDNSYFFKKSHSIAYAMVIIVQMNLLVEQYS